MVWVQHWVHHLEADCDNPIWRPWLALLARRHTLIRYDWRGCGCRIGNINATSIPLCSRSRSRRGKAAGIPALWSVSAWRGRAGSPCLHARAPSAGLPLCWKVRAEGALLESRFHRRAWKPAIGDDQLGWPRQCAWPMASSSPSAASRGCRAQARRGPITTCGGPMACKCSSDAERYQADVKPTRPARAASTRTFPLAAGGHAFDEGRRFAKRLYTCPLVPLEVVTTCCWRRTPLGFPVRGSAGWVLQREFLPGAVIIPGRAHGDLQARRPGLWRRPELVPSRQGLKISQPARNHVANIFQQTQGPAVAQAVIYPPAMPDLAAAAFSSPSLGSSDLGPVISAAAAALSRSTARGRWRSTPPLARSPAAGKPRR